MYFSRYENIDFVLMNYKTKSFYMLKSGAGYINKITTGEAGVYNFQYFKIKHICDLRRHLFQMKLQPLFYCLIA